MKKKMGLLALVGLLVLAGCGQEDAIAEVNGVKISQAKFDEQLDMYGGMLAVQYGMPETIQNLLIQDVLIEQDLKKNDVEVSNDRYEQDFQAEVSKMGGEDAYQKMLQTYRITDAIYRDTLKSETRYRVHKEWFDAQNPPSQEEIDAYFNNNKQSLMKLDFDQILVATEEEANAVKERLDNGEDFATVAAEVSTDAATKDKGGSLGSVLASTVLSNYGEPFVNAVLALEPGTTSGPISSPYGFHVVHLNSKSDTAETLKDDIVAALNQSKYTDYLTSLRDAATITLKEDSSEPEATIYETSGEGASTESTAPETSTPADTSDNGASTDASNAPATETSASSAAESAPSESSGQ